MTLYEKTIKEMTIEQFAQLSVRPAVMNGMDMYYVTTSGQLFPFNAEGFHSAVMYQHQILSQKIPEDNAAGNEQTIASTEE